MRRMRGERWGDGEKKIGSGNKNGDRNGEIRKRGDEMMDEKGVWCENRAGLRCGGYVMWGNCDGFCYN
jgi:hypothetical protein